MIRCCPPQTAKYIGCNPRHRMALRCKASRRLLQICQDNTWQSSPLSLPCEPETLTQSKMHTTKRSRYRILALRDLDTSYRVAVQNLPYPAYNYCSSFLICRLQVTSHQLVARSQVLQHDASQHSAPLRHPPWSHQCRAVRYLQGT